MSDSKPGRRKGGNVIKIHDLPKNPIRQYLILVARDTGIKGGISAAGRMVLETAMHAGQFLEPASMRELQQDQSQD